MSNWCLEDKIKINGFHWIVMINYITTYEINNIGLDANCLTMSKQGITMHQIFQAFALFYALGHTEEFEAIYNQVAKDHATNGAEDDDNNDDEDTDDDEDDNDDDDNKNA